ERRRCQCSSNGVGILGQFFIFVKAARNFMADLGIDTDLADRLSKDNCKNQNVTVCRAARYAKRL
ncbi:MAG: hypothetical protein AAFY72_13790, partial [Cyanobacteria bacterium J06649_4]